MEKKFDVIGIENLIMDFALQINKLPKTDGLSRHLTQTFFGYNL